VERRIDRQEAVKIECKNGEISFGTTPKENIRIRTTIAVASTSVREISLAGYFGYANGTIGTVRSASRARSGHSKPPAPPLFSSAQKTGLTDRSG
jgi:hypothetical protein